MEAMVMDRRRKDTIEAYLLYSLMIYGNGSM